MNNFFRMWRLKNSAQGSWGLFLTVFLIQTLGSCWKENFPDLPDVLSFSVLTFPFGHRNLLTPVLESDLEDAHFCW